MATTEEQYRACIRDFDRIEQAVWAARLAASHDGETITPDEAERIVRDAWEAAHA